MMIYPIGLLMPTIILALQWQQGIEEEKNIGSKK